MTLSCLKMLKLTPEVSHQMDLDLLLLNLINTKIGTEYCDIGYYCGFANSKLTFCSYPIRPIRIHRLNSYNANYNYFNKICKKSSENKNYNWSIPTTEQMDLIKSKISKVFNHSTTTHVVISNLGSLHPKLTYSLTPVLEIYVNSS